MAQKRSQRPRRPHHKKLPKRQPKRRNETPPRAREAQDDADNLTKAQARLLTVFANPDHLRCGNDELAHRAEISRAQFYRIMADPLMRRRRYELIQESLVGVIGEVMHSTVESALLPGREGAADRKLLLETVGVYTPASKQIHELKGPVRMDGDMPDEELVYLYLACKLPPPQWMPGVLQRYEQGLITPKKPNTGPSLMGTV